jgi:hypothetical protein
MFAVALSLATQAHADQLHPNRIVIGRITDNPRSDYTRLKGLLDQVHAETRRTVGVTRGCGTAGAGCTADGRLPAARTCRLGHRDAGHGRRTPQSLECAQPFMRALARRQKRLPKPRSLFVATVGIQTLVEALRGKRIALQSRCINECVLPALDHPAG